MARGRVKRQQVAAEDGWTVITHGLSNVSLDDDHQKSKGKTAKTSPLSTIPGMVSGLTPEKLLVEFKTLQERWEDTLLARQIDDVFSGRKEHDAGEEKETEKEKEGNGDGHEMCWGVNEAVCIGIGSFSRDWAHRWRSLWQLVLFVDVVGKFRPADDQSTTTPLLCYASDPAFTPVDAAFLSLLHIKTLAADEPASSSELAANISPSTFVYSPFVDWFLLLPAFLKDRDPRVYVGNEILSDYTVFAQTAEKRDMLDVCNEVGRKWLERRRVVRLREFEKHGTALGGLVVYLRKRGEA